MLCMAGLVVVLIKPVLNSAALVRPEDAGDTAALVRTGIVVLEVNLEAGT